MIIFRLKLKKHKKNQKEVLRRVKLVHEIKADYKKAGRKPEKGFDI